MRGFLFANFLPAYKTAIKILFKKEADSSLEIVYWGIKVTIKKHFLESLRISEDRLRVTMGTIFAKRV